MSSRTLSAVVLLAALLLVSCSKDPTYTTYEDCVLQTIGASQTREAVIALQDACYAKFPPPEKQLAATHPSEMDWDGFNQAAADASAAADAAADAASDAAASSSSSR